jgi:hypothetical protein
MKVSIITTVNHNVGDDFVREGIKYLLKKYFKNENIEFQNIHKHSPITSRYGYESFRFNKIRIMNIIDNLLPLKFSKDRVLDCDILIQSGAPVYWCHDKAHCYNNEWYKPLIEKRFLKNKNAKLLNLAAGTCQTYHSNGNEFCDKCNEYIKEFYNISSITTTRDTLAKNVLAKIGINAPVIPCSSIFAIDEHGLKSQGADYVVMNYMKGGAHYTFGQKIDFEKWEKEFKKFYFELKEKENVIISCHNQKEVDEALELDPSAEIFYKKDDYLEYMKFYSKAKFGIMNRVHGAFLMASYGKPSIVIGNDSRARMVEEIGLRHYFVNDIDYDLLTNELKTLQLEQETFNDKFALIKNKAYKDYIKILSNL